MKKQLKSFQYFAIINFPCDIYTMNKICILLISLFTISMTLPSCQSNTSPTNHSLPGSISGKELFEQNCVRCHGEEGDAAVNNAANLQLSKADTISIIHLVQQGRREMPSFEGVLKDSDIHKIANYVITLRK